MKNKYFLEIPKEIADYLDSNIEISKTNEGIYIKKRGNNVSPIEFALLKKLNSFKFEKRTPPNVNKTLTENEKRALESLIKKKIVTLYKGGKYKKTGVYSISQSIYPELIGKTDQSKKNKSLLKNDYLIIDNKTEAQKLSAKLKEEIKSGEVRGTRGFDGKFYIATSDFYNKHRAAILKVLEKNKIANLKQINTETKLNESACLVILRLLDEKGEIIEKEKNMFSLI